MWECSKDLAMYLHETTTTRTTASATSSSITTGSGRVLELGCGAALPGIAALCLGKCSRGAVFCDLNRSVLLETTWPSICMNVHHHILAKGDDPAAVCGPIRCFSGDWLQVSEQLLAEADELRCTLCHFTVLLARQTTYYLLSDRQDGAKFDLILAAEANYCAESSAKVGESLYVHQIILMPTIHSTYSCCRLFVRTWRKTARRSLLRSDTTSALGWAEAASSCSSNCDPWHLQRALGGYRCSRCVPLRTAIRMSEIYCAYLGRHLHNRV